MLDGNERNCSGTFNFALHQIENQRVTVCSFVSTLSMYVYISLLPTDIDECTDETDNCEQTCMNTNGSFVCGCNPGYMLDGNGRNCSGTFNFALHQIENQRVTVCSFVSTLSMYVFPFPLQTLMSAQMRQTTVNKPA